MRHATEKYPLPEELRDALGCFATGVAIVTGIHPEFGPVGLTISSFNSVSLAPPLVLWSISINAPSRAAFTKGALFCVNILSSDQIDLCRKFARFSEDKFAGVETETGLGGLRLIKGSVAQFQCAVEDAIPAGDHELYIGRVVETCTDKTRAPLIFHRSRLSELPVSA